MNYDKPSDEIMDLVKKYFNKHEIYDLSCGKLLKYLKDNTKNYDELKEQRIKKLDYESELYDEVITHNGKNSSRINFDTMKEIPFFNGYSIDITDILLNKMDEFKKWSEIQEKNLKIREEELRTIRFQDHPDNIELRKKNKQTFKEYPVTNVKDMDIMVFAFMFYLIDNKILNNEFENYHCGVFYILYDPVKVANKLVENKIYTTKSKYFDDSLNYFVKDMRYFDESINYFPNYIDYFDDVNDPEELRNDLRHYGYDGYTNIQYNNLLFMATHSICDMLHIDRQCIENFMELYILDPNYKNYNSSCYSSLLISLMNEKVNMSDSARLYFLELVDTDTLNFTGKYDNSSLLCALSLKNQDIAVKIIRCGFSKRYFYMPQKNIPHSYLKKAIKDKKYDIACELIITHIGDFKYIYKDIHKLKMAELLPSQLKLLKDFFGDINIIKNIIDEI